MFGGAPAKHFSRFNRVHAAINTGAGAAGTRAPTPSPGPRSSAKPAGDIAASGRNKTGYRECLEGFGMVMWGRLPLQVKGSLECVPLAAETSVWLG